MNGFLVVVDSLVALLSSSSGTAALSFVDDLFDFVVSTDTVKLNWKHTLNYLGESPQCK